MKPLEIKNNIYWVGAVDWDLRDFHGYSTEKGSTYNAYLVVDKKTVLFDTVKVELQKDLLANIQQITDPSRIDYIVVNHAEMDHSGSLPHILNIVKPEKIFCTAKCKDALIRHFHDESWQFEVIKEGDSIELGEKTIQFFDSKMMHWPESMVSYIPEDNLLISNDIFGQHWATSERFDDEVDQGELYWQSAKYYANIFMPFATPAQKFLKKLKENDLKIDMIAVDHGLIWRKDVDKIIGLYDKWSSGRFDKKAIVIYDTMWGSTKKMARAIGKGIASQDISVQVLDLRFNHRSDVITEALDSRAIILGSPVMNNNILPGMGGFLTYMKGLRPKNKIGGAFGSYGWSDKATKILKEYMDDLKFDIIGDGLSTQYVPTDDVLNQCYEYGVEIGKAVNAG
ncbi:MAG: FprA family A-type flavoprotein [candidate division Zixibacteria bacterium]|nr:FprA family A-type flavoprotein [candidate division Zixibacteria bacterium]NIR68299.1 FprA family A-type flavoprotein [candidate division Zixibacteria bacterium]NIS18273.1 FprA family A-type flavoprotein [candidate division Zixibacteria bacterium]NIS49465.1 FprA family A-type flavoprotein [candidate division Zixibacteria bacterium]NIT54581.1 FprA family A-type flavoprotein [candidate division Zixibacteria bacterium]